MYFGEKYLSEYPTFYLENYRDLDTSDIQINEQEFIDILNEKMDMDEGFGSKLRPIFVVLVFADSMFDKIAEKFVKEQEFWHAAISFGPALSNCYSFNFAKDSTNAITGGLSFESIDFYKKNCPNGDLQVGAIFVDQAKFKKVKEALDFYLRNKQKTKYSWINLLYSYLGKSTKDGLNFNQVCSTFVDSILKFASIDLNNKHTNLVKPDDLKNTNEKNYFKVFSGKITSYDAIEVKNRSEQLANKVSNNYFKKKKD